MTIKPHTTLSILLSVYLVLFAASLFIPEEGIRLTNDLSISFFDPKSFFEIKQNNYADISEIIKQNESLIDTALAVAEITPKDTIVGFDTIRANADSLKSTIPKIEFPEGNAQMLHPVFKSMESASSEGKLMRIMHFGDSQIEGDRMTSLIRYKLQKQFGGNGVGLIPARQMYDFRYSLFHEASDNWHRYPLYGKRDTNITHKRYGILANFCSFTPQPRDSIQIDSSEKHAWISLQESPYSYSNTKQFDRCRIFYGFNEDPFMAELHVNGELLDADIYPQSERLNLIDWTFTEPVSDIELHFKSTSSPELYGIALDGQSGVAVDNIAMRGSSGLVFTKMDQALFGELVKMLDVKLLILQFGGNVVPNVVDSYGYYERWFHSQLKYIKEAAPNIEIIVIGVADMSRKENNQYESYPNIEKVRDAMKKASFRAGAAYWDMYEAMGGKNSMPAWVFAQPPLATKDFVHFNTRGAKIMANMFYNAFIHEYNVYKRAKATSDQLAQGGGIE